MSTKSKTLIKRARITLVAIIAILIVIVVFQNMTHVETKVLFLSFTMPRAVLLIATLLIGFLVGFTTHDLIVRRFGGNR